MAGSENIIAINKDANASPIFEFSDLDIIKILPNLTTALRARRDGGT